MVGQLEFNFNDVLGLTRKGNVFKGKLQDGRCAAIKKYPHSTNIKELDILLHLSKQGSTQMPPKDLMLGIF